ncbi:SCO2400 family protein, partial [Streptomyces cinereoruber]
MDYCHACRRHLNGALACAGCGTPVEELRYETPRAAAPRPTPAAAPEHVYELDVVEPPR